MRRDSSGAPLVQELTSRCGEWAVIYGCKLYVSELSPGLELVALFLGPQPICSATEVNHSLALYVEWVHLTWTVQWI